MKIIDTELLTFNNLLNLSPHIKYSTKHNWQTQDY